MPPEADSTPRFCVVTGVPGVGKSSVANWLRHRLPAGWTVTRKDDFVGVTQAIYPGRPWPEVRRFAAIFAGWSAGWYLAMGRGVLLEGVVQDSEELDRLGSGARDLAPSTPYPSVVTLEGDLEEIALRIASNPYRDPQWSGPDRLERIRAMLEAYDVDLEGRGPTLDTRAKSIEEVSKEVAMHLRIPLSKQ